MKKVFAKNILIELSELVMNFMNVNTLFFWSDKKNSICEWKLNGVSKCLLLPYGESVYY